jgi:hypothetical protein
VRILQQIASMLARQHESALVFHLRSEGGEQPLPLATMDTMLPSKRVPPI